MLFEGNRQTASIWRAIIGFFPTYQFHLHFFFVAHVASRTSIHDRFLHNKLGTCLIASATLLISLPHSSFSWILIRIPC